MRPRRRCEIEVVLDIGAETTGIGDRRGISKGVAVDVVSEGVIVGDAALMALRVGGRDWPTSCVVVGVSG